MTAFLGVDLGTSGLKLVRVDGDGIVRAEAEASYEVSTGDDGRAETDPRAWFEALQQAVAELPAASRDVAAIGITGQMHGVVVTDDHSTPLRPAILWADRRAELVLHRWRALPRQDRAALANPVVAGMAGPILDWLSVYVRYDYSHNDSNIPFYEYDQHVVSSGVVARF